MTRDDLEHVRWLEDTALEQARPVAVWERELAAPAFGALVAEADGRVVAFLGYQLAADELSVIQLAVAPEARRKGTARALLEAVMALGTARGASACYLEVRAGNKAGRRLYDGLGFDIVEERPGYYRSPPDDALVLARALA